MKITATSDIHGAKPPKIGEHGGEILIIAGDLTNRGTINEITQFIFNWELFCSVFDKVFIIPGNHDTCMTQPEVIEMITTGIPNAKVFFGGTYEQNYETTWENERLNQCIDWWLSSLLRILKINPK